MNDPDLKLLLGVVILIVFGVVGWHYRDQLFPPPEAPVEVIAPTPVEPEAESGPKYPIPISPDDEVRARNLVPLPPLDDSDAYFLLEVDATLGTAIESLLVREAVIDRLVTSIDNLTREHVSEKIRPVGRLEQSFRPESENDVITLGPANFSRYDALVTEIANADTAAIVELYQRFYPLFQKSYERLGYPDAYFNDRLVEVIDHLLATPVSDEPLRLVRPNVLYKYADPDLEALSSGQKLLLRMGPGNAETIKQVLRDVRDRLD
jgi:hypothetical protein